MCLLRYDLFLFYDKIKINLLQDHPTIAQFQHDQVVFSYAFAYLFLIV